MISLVNDDMFSVIRRVDVCRETMKGCSTISLSTSGWNRVDQCRSKRVLLSTAYLMLDGPDNTRLNHAVK